MASPVVIDSPCAVPSFVVMTWCGVVVSVSIASNTGLQEPEDTWASAEVAMAAATSERNSRRVMDEGPRLPGDRKAVGRAREVHVQGLARDDGDVRECEVLRACDDRDSVLAGWQVHGAITGIALCDRFDG